MANIVCPECGSDDLIGGKEERGRIPVRCERCGHSWDRVPPPVCSRCGSKDVEVSVVEDSWAYLDKEAAREDTMAPFEYLDKEAYRCRHCHRRWEKVFGTTPPPGKDEGIKTFIDDDSGYQAWLRQHYRGYVINCARTPGPDYLILHTADCTTITGTPARGKTFTGDYIKVCSGSRDELRQWALANVGADLQPCRTCLS